MKRKSITYICLAAMTLLFTACGTKQTPSEASPAQNITEATETEESGQVVSETGEGGQAVPETEEAAPENSAPSKDEVLSMRETVLSGMTEEEKERLTENIKVANLQMEDAYLNDNLFDRLADKDSMYWNYFDQKGDIQVAVAFDGSVNMKETMESEGISEEQFYEEYGQPVIVYNRFDADNFIALIEDMQKTVHNELLAADLQQLIDATKLAAETHEMEYANDIYKILHDMDYFLLRYGIDDVGVYTRYDDVVSKYYGVLNVYGETPLVTE